MICNIWYVKNIHKATLQHLSSKQWQLYIDYIIMKREDCGMCLDISVKRGAECSTDHHFLCATLKWRWKLSKHEEVSKMMRNL